MAAKKILIVDDDHELRTALAEQLAEGANFAVVQASNFEQGLDQILNGQFDAALFDLELPDGNGLDLCKRAREGGITIPIIMLTGYSDEDSTVSGFKVGASDYVAKPFRYHELVARLNTRIRQYESSDHAVHHLGPWQFHPSSRELVPKTGGRTVRLTDKECAILRYLLRQQGQIVKRSELLRDVWGYHADADTHTLETHIYRLRQKTKSDSGDDEDDRSILVTEEGGYRIRQD